MKSKLLVGVSLFAILVGPQSAMAFCEDCWGSVGWKYWDTTLTPGDGRTYGRTDGAKMFSATLGYGKFFLNNSVSGLTPSVSSSNLGTLSHFSGSLQLGYIPTPNLMITIGGKTVKESWYDSTTNQTVDILSSTVSNGSSAMQSEPFRWIKPIDFVTAGASYSYKFSDSGFAASGTLVYGQRNLAASTTLFNGTTSGTSSFLGYDLGGSYNFTKSLVLSAFYRIESWDALAPITINPIGSAYVANLAMVKMSLGGPGVGISYSF